MMKWNWNLIACYAWATTGTINFCHAMYALCSDKLSEGGLYLFITFLNIGACIFFHRLHQIKESQKNEQ